MILYSNHCPRCDVLKRKLDDKGIIYDLCDNTNIMIDKGFMSSPKLELDNGEILDFVQAINWVQKEVRN